MTFCKQFLLTTRFNIDVYVSVFYVLKRVVEVTYFTYVLASQIGEFMSMPESKNVLKGKEGKEVYNQAEKYQLKVNNKSAITASKDIYVFSLLSTLNRYLHTNYQVLSVDECII